MTNYIEAKDGNGNTVTLPFKNITSMALQASSEMSLHLTHTELGSLVAYSIFDHHASLIISRREAARIYHAYKEWLNGPVSMTAADCL